MNDWIYKKVNEKNIINYSLAQCIQFLGSESIFLHDYGILCIGYKNKIKQFYHLQILASSPHSKTLQGPHEIVVHDSKETSLQFWVWSLTTLRKKFFEFSDRLSFERSSFLILHEHKVLLRLKSIRSLLNISRKYPQQIQKVFSYEKIKSLSISLNNPIVDYIQRKNANRVSIRVKVQQQKLLEQSFTSYLREFENTSLTRKDILEKFKNDIHHNLQRLSDPSENNAEGKNEIFTEFMEENENDFELHEIDFCY